MLLPIIYDQHQQKPSLNCQGGTEAVSDMACLFTPTVLRCSNVAYMQVF